MTAAQQQQAPSLLDYLTAASRLVIEGTPSDWQGQSLDLELKGLAGQTLHTRGWVQPEGKGWLLQLLDIGDLIAHRQLTQVREHNQRVSDQISEQLRVCSLVRLPEVLQDTLQAISQHWHIPLGYPEKEKGTGCRVSRQPGQWIADGSEN